MQPDIRELLTYICFFDCHPTLCDFRYYESEGESWVTLGGTEGRPAPMAAARHYHPENFDDEGPATVSFWEPTWLDYERPYRAYVPDMALLLLRTGSRVAEWMYTFLDDISPYMEPLEPDELGDSVTALVTRDFRQAQAVLNKLKGVAGLAPDRILDGYRLSDLYARRGEDDVREGLQTARAKMLDLLGAISYSFERADSTLQASVRSEHADDWERWSLDEASKLGFLLDLQDPRVNTLPILEYMAHRVPIYYPYDSDYRPRLSLERRLGMGENVDEDNFAEMFNRLVVRAAPAFLTLIERVEDRSLLSRLQQVAPNRFSHTFPLPPSAFAGDENDGADSSPETGAVNDDGIDPYSAARRHLGNYWHFGQAPPLSLLGLQWSRHLLETGRIVLGYLEELKLRLWVQENQISDVEEVLTEMVQRGMKFEIFLPEDQLDGFRERQPAQWRLPDVLPYYVSPQHVDPVLLYSPSPVLGFNRWRASAVEVLGRPHARNFFKRGSVECRLAAAMGSEGLPRRFASGPSSTLLLYSIGERGLGNYVFETVQPESEMLVGLSHGPDGRLNRTWWPRAEYFSYAGLDVGEWTGYHEDWFRHRFDAYARGGAAGGPFNRYNWNRELASVASRMHEDLGGFPDRDRSVALLKRIQDVEGKWNGTVLKDLPLA